MPHSVSPDRYSTMMYRRCGNSGLKLPAISVGTWQHFGKEDRNSVNRDELIITSKASYGMWEGAYGEVVNPEQLAMVRAE